MLDIKIFILKVEHHSLPPVEDGTIVDTLHSSIRLEFVTKKIETITEAKI